MTEECVLCKRKYEGPLAYIEHFADKCVCPHCFRIIDPDARHPEDRSACRVYRTRVNGRDMYLLTPQSYGTSYAGVAHEVPFPSEWPIEDTVLCRDESSFGTLLLAFHQRGVQDKIRSTLSRVLLLLYITVPVFLLVWLLFFLYRAK